jgi:glycosyltransferase involved in cell wall biosynthesis
MAAVHIDRRASFETQPLLYTPAKMAAFLTSVSTPAPDSPMRFSGHDSVSIVIPCFNEEDGILHLKEKLDSTRLLLQEACTLQLILIDDGSTDGTWNAMRRFFQHEPDCVLLRHPENLGIGAAILTGIHQASTEVVCSIDSDCTYDPAELVRMIPLLTPGVDLVTASPYHPLGEVRHVPAWRLFLSRAASFFYRLVCKQKLHTYTSCFRVYRRSRILKLRLRQQGFLAVAELIAKLDLQGSVIVECPAKLTSRDHGVSKMKTAEVLIGHFQLLAALALARARQTLSATPQSASPRLGDL